MSDTSKHKKTYSRLHASPFSENVKPSNAYSDLSAKKIIPSNAEQSLRDKFKEMFLPLLIDILELRQMIDVHKMQAQAPDLPYFGKVSKTPEEILARLTQMQKDIEESQRWCEGVILQIAKGITETQEALQLLQTSHHLENSQYKNKLSIKRFFLRLKDFVWKQKQPQ